jgi:hypothetical protein
MSESTKRYFVCTYGNFDRDSDFLKHSISENAYRLHLAARYPEALGEIRKGDTILLQNYCWVVAYGIATDSVTKDEHSDWRHVLRVGKWRSLNPDRIEDGVRSYGIREATEIGGSMSVVKKVSEDWATSILSHFERTRVTLSEHTLSCKDLLLNELLKLKLQIPTYQRGYCWSRDQVVGLLNDIDEWTARSSPDKPYHLGTVIVKSRPEGTYDVIDGQQRLLTFSILAFVANRLCGADFETPLLDSRIATTNNEGEKATGYLLRTLKTIEDWIQTKGYPSSECVRNAVKQMFSSVMLCVVNIPESESEDLAYSFFNTTNSTGVRLSDYDLLKTHHLRYVPETSAGFVAARWNRLSEENRHEELLHLLLYRLRNWCRRDDFHTWADDTRCRQLFTHFSVNIPPLAGLYDIPLPPKIDSILSGGIEFFNYVESYQAKLHEFDQLPSVDALAKALGHHSNGVLHHGIKAVLFMFYCKFGRQYIKEALYCIAYRISELRNAGQVRMNYLRTKPVFTNTVCMLDRSTVPGEFFAWTIHPRYAYKPDFGGSTKCAYWHSLSILLHDLETDEEYAIESSTQTITPVFSQSALNQEAANV